MLDINRHKFLLVSLLKDIYTDIELATALGFKGGTAHMLFYDLPRFSVDLDFNLLSKEMGKVVFEKTRNILLQHGRIKDEAEKHFGLLCVLDYGVGTRNLKVEISNREYPDRYEIKNYLGIPMMVMEKQDMFAHKLCALLDRKVFTSRDVFDVYFYMKDKTPVNKQIVELRMQMSFEAYMDACIERIALISTKKLLDGIGDLIDDKLKTFVRNRLKQECLQFLQMYKAFPITQ